MSCFCQCFGDKQKSLKMTNINAVTENEKIEEKVRFNQIHRHNVKNQEVTNEYDKFQHNRKFSANLTNENQKLYQIESNAGLALFRNKKLNIYDTKHKIKEKKPLYDLKDKFMCFFCGGNNCKHENWSLHPHPAIKGLNSDQISENIYASQRLSNRLIGEFNLIKRFKELNIGLIVNLQREGEHPYCGDKLDPNSGFSYDPQKLISEEIKCKNYGWKDMSIPDSVHFMLNIVRDMALSIKEEKRKVLVHCHAGYGRTGCAIACYMIFDSDKSVESIVKGIRSIRKKCIEKKQQLDFCHKFREYIIRARMIFTSTHLPIDSFMKNQNDLIYSEDDKKFRLVPRLLFIVFEKIMIQKNEEKITNKYIYDNLYFISEWTNTHEEQLVEIKKQLNKGNWDALYNCDHIPTHILLFYDWLEDCVDSLVLPEKINTLFTKKLSKEEIELQVKEYRSLDRSMRRGQCNIIKAHFRLIEFEILLSLAEFLGNIVPQEEELIDSYNRMTDRLCLEICGLSIDKINYKIVTDASKAEEANKDLPNEIIVLFKNFRLLIQFLSIIIKVDMIEDNVSQFIGTEQNQSKEILQNKSKSSIFSKSEKIPLENNVNIVNPQSEKEQMMYLMYNALDQYFKNKNIPRKKSLNFNSSLESMQSRDDLRRVKSNLLVDERKFASPVPHLFASEDKSLLNLRSNSFYSKGKSGLNNNNPDVDELFDMMEKFKKFINFQKSMNSTSSVQKNSNSQTVQISTINSINKKRSSGNIYASPNIHNSIKNKPNLVILNNSNNQLENDQQEEYKASKTYFPMKYNSVYDAKLAIIEEDNFSENYFNKSSQGKNTIKNHSETDTRKGDKKGSDNTQKRRSNENASPNLDVRIDLKERRISYDVANNMWVKSNMSEFSLFKKNSSFLEKDNVLKLASNKDVKKGDSNLTKIQEEEIDIDSIHHNNSINRVRKNINHASSQKKSKVMLETNILEENALEQFKYKRKKSGTNTLAIKSRRILSENSCHLIMKRNTENI